MIESIVPVQSDTGTAPLGEIHSDNESVREQGRVTEKLGQSGQDDRTRETRTTSKKRQRV